MSFRRQQRSDEFCSQSAAKGVILRSENFDGMKIVQFLKDWTLIIAILAGIGGYFVYVSIPWLAPTHALAREAVAIVQPLLIFAMLFLTFCKIEPRQLPWR